MNNITLFQLSTTRPTSMAFTINIKLKILCLIHYKRSSPSSAAIDLIAEAIYRDDLAIGLNAEVIDVLVLIYL